MFYPDSARRNAPGRFRLERKEVVIWNREPARLCRVVGPEWNIDGIRHQPGVWLEGCEICKCACVGQGGWKRRSLFGRHIDQSLECSESVIDYEHVAIGRIDAKARDACFGGEEAVGLGVRAPVIS